MGCFLYIDQSGTFDDGLDGADEYGAEAWDEPAASVPLCELPPGPWRSSGGFLNYEDWPDRERFIELDRAIAATWQGRSEALENFFKRPKRRCRSRMPTGENCNRSFLIGENYIGWRCEEHREARQNHALEIASSGGIFPGN